MRCALAHGIPEAEAERGMPDTWVNSAVSPSTGSVAITTMLSGARRAISGASDRMRPAFTV